MINDNQFIFTDESGNIDFSPKSSKHAIVTGIIVNNSYAKLLGDYWSLRHDLYINPVEYGSDQRIYTNKRFHAAEDPQKVRDKVFELITLHSENICDRSLIVEKANVYNYLQRDEWLIGRMYYYWFKSLFNSTNWIENKNSLQIIIDHTKTKRLRSATISGIKRSHSNYGNKLPYRLHHTPSGCHPFIQLADYICWALLRKYERNDLRSYNLISGLIEDEWNMI